MPITGEHLVHMLRASALQIVLAIAFTLSGLAALSFQIFTRRRRDPAVLWFSLFSLFYGIRLLIEAEPVRLCLGMDELSQNYLRAGLSYFLPILGSLFVHAIFPAWRSLFRWIVLLQTLLALAGLICDQIFRQPFVLLQLNNVVVIIWILFLITIPLRTDRTVESRVLSGGFIAFGITAIAANIGGLVRRNFDFELFGFAICLVCLTVVVVRRSVQAQERLTAIEEELAIARRIQTSILPRTPPQSDSVHIAARYLSMAAVAGDFYDFLVLEERRLGALVADVTGHGVPAALIASMIKVAAAAQLSHAGDPARVLRGMNQTLCPNLQGQYVTAAYLFLDLPAKKFRYAAAGHPRMQWLQRGANGVEAIEENGLFMGLTAAASYASVEHSFDSGDRFLLFTDGLLEATDRRDEFFGEARLQQIMLDSAHLAAHAAADHIIQHLSAWAGYDKGRAQEDDLTLLVIDMP